MMSDDQCVYCRKTMDRVSDEQWHCPTCGRDFVYEVIAVERSNAPKSFAEFLSGDANVPAWVARLPKEDVTLIHEVRLI